MTDGERVIASFASDGLYCYDFGGKELWRRTDLGRQIHIWGNAASPVIYGDLCFLNFGPGETTYLLAVDKKTGKTVWKHDEETGYGKPPAGDVPRRRRRKRHLHRLVDHADVMMKVEGKDQLLMSWPRRLAAYDPQTGKELWTCSGLNPLVYTSPIYRRRHRGRDGRLQRHRDRRARGRQRRHHRVAPRSGITANRRSASAPASSTTATSTSTTIRAWRVLRTQDRRTPSGRSGSRAPAPTGANWSSVMLADGNCYTITQGGDCFVFKAQPEV